MIRDEFVLAYRDMIRNAKEYKCDSCIVRDTLGQYMDMRLEFGIDMVNICQWEMICRIYVPKEGI